MSSVNRPSGYRRLKLLAGGSLSALWLMAGAGFFDAALAPSAARAADECGDPAANGSEQDVFLCSGTFDAITYPTSEGLLALFLEDDLAVTTGGITATAAPDDSVLIRFSSSNISITSTSGVGIDVTTSGSAFAFVGNPNDAYFGDVQGVTAGIRVSGEGLVSVGAANGSITATDGAAIDLTGGDISVNSGAVVTGTTAAILVRAGNSVSLINAGNGVLVGGIQLHNTGPVSATNNGVWRTSGTNFLGDGDTTFANVLGSVISIDGTTVLDFGLGANSFTNQGVILFGRGEDDLSTNGSPTDRLVFTGTGYAASGINAKLVMDVNFSGAGQADCAAAVTADCFDLRGLSTSGTTSIVVNSLGGMGSLKPVVLVDVNGGTSAASDFTLSMDSVGYTDVGTGGGIDTGMFVYRLGYDAATQRHELVPYAGAGARTFALTGAALRSVWDTTTGSYFNRQADLQHTIEARGSGSGPGVWLKAAGGHVQRTYKPGSDVGGDIKIFDDSYSQSTKGLVGGIDFLNVQSGDQAWVAGVTAGKVKADLDFTVGPNKVRMDGTSYGAYASFLSGGFFVDGIINANKLDLKFGGSGFDGVEAKADTLGWQAETGYRLSDSAGAIFIEPLLTLAYVTTDVKDLPVSDNLTVSFDKAKSFRGAVGARLGGKLELQNFIAGMAITGRVWDEFKGDNGIHLVSGDQSMALVDGSDSALGDVGATFNLISKDGRWSGFADYSFKFMDDYSDSQASVGVRVNW